MRTPIRPCGPVLGARASNQFIGLAFQPTRGTRGLLSIDAMAGYATLVRSIQYNRTANFLAAATLATALHFLCARCRYSRLNSGSNRTVVCAASTSNILMKVLPCLVIEPSLCLLPEVYSEGMSPR